MPWPPISDELAEVVADSMDAPPELVPYLPTLLADLEDLGARAVDVVHALEGAGLTASSRVLDLGCGKGAAALALAERYGCHVVGLDALPDFIRHANAQAKARGLEQRVRFDVGDLELLEPSDPPYDMVSLLALGGLYGDTDDTVEALREHVSPGGLILLDEAYLSDPENAAAELREVYDSREDLVAKLQRHGDRVVTELAVDGPDTRAHYREVIDRLSARAQMLAATHPEVARAALTFADHQASQLAYLDSPVSGALWLLRKEG